MKVITSIEAAVVSGAYASMSGGFSMGPHGMTFEHGFSIAVTDNSSNVMGNFAAYPNKVVDLLTGAVLYNGTQDSFCINGGIFGVSAISGGHRYTYIGPC